MKSIIIGIDISAKTLDICIDTNGVKEFLQIENSVKVITKFFNNYSKHVNYTFIGMENTGKYNWNLYQVLEEHTYEVFVIHPFHLKKSLGLIRGKNDKIDAQRISEFVQKNKDSLTPWKACSDVIQSLKTLASERKSKVKSKAKLLQQYKDYKLIKDIKLRSKLIQMCEKQMNLLKQQIIDLDDLIEDTIKQDTKVKGQIDRIRTIPGVGKVLSCEPL